MSEMFIDRTAILQESEKLKKLKVVVKRNRKDSWLDLRPYAGEIIFMAVERRFSRRHIADILKSRHKFTVSHNRIYHFVRSLNGGEWPNSRKDGGK